MTTPTPDEPPGTSRPGNIGPSSYPTVEDDGGSAPPQWFSKIPAISYVRRIKMSDPVRAGDTTHIGTEVERILGYGPAEFILDPDLWAARVHPDDLARVLGTWRDTSEVGSRYHLAYRMVARGGRLVHVHDTAAVEEEEGSGIRSWCGVVVDVTADRRTAPTLREAEAKYRLLVEQIPAVTYIDEVPEDDPTDLTPAYISPQLERLLGYAPHEWLADPDLWNQVTHPDDVDAAEAGARRSFEDGSPLSIEYRMVARDGRTVFASVSHSRSCRSRSSRSRNRRCLKNEPLTQPTRFSTLPFSCGRYGQQTSTPMPRSSVTPANVGFHSVTTPSWPNFSATVFGRSNTATKGMPPNAAT